MRIVGLIPARGGSKGIPRKNLQTVGENSLVAIKILQAKASMCNEIWVSTEDSEIAELAQRYGAGVIERPDRLAEDFAGSDDVLIHAIETLELSPKDTIVMLQPTSPLLRLSSVDGCINNLLLNPTLNSVLTLKEAHPFMWEQTADKFWNPSGHKREFRPMRQEFNPSGWETGGCYAARVDSVLATKLRFPEPTGLVSVNHIEALDIDVMEDLVMARAIFGTLNASKEDRIY